MVGVIIIIRIQGIFFYVKKETNKPSFSQRLTKQQQNKKKVEGELELLMCGIGVIDVRDWKQNTVYKVRTLISRKKTVQPYLLQFFTIFSG